MEKDEQEKYAWMEWAERNSCRGQWRSKKARTVVDQEDESDSDADIEDDDVGMIWLPGDEEFDSVDNVQNNVGEDDDNEGNEDGSHGREKSDDDSDASSSIEEMRKGGVNGRGDRKSYKRRCTGVSIL